MAPRIFCLILLICVLHEIKCKGPPKITRSYKAWGEITQGLSDMPAKVQIAFEESYNSKNQNAAFVIWMAGKNVTFIKNFDTNQTFRYIEGKDCTLTSEEEWIKSDYPPGLLKYEDTNGTVSFTLMQLFNIPDKFLKEENVSTVFRGIPARKWVYEIPSMNKSDDSKHVIYSFWSENGWDTSSNEDVVPLGFTVSTMQRDASKQMKVTEGVNSIFGFVTGTYDYKLFEPFQGIICPNRAQTLKFPNVQNIKAIAVHSEMVLPDYPDIRYIDTWFNPGSQLVRIDLERFKDEDPNTEKKTKRYESEIAIGKMGVVFHKSIFLEEFKCEVIPFSKYQNDMQNFIDVTQDLSRWKMGRLFGLNDTTYVFTGKTKKSDTACHLFQGVRKDWPEASANVESLWEWCFNANITGPGKALFRDDEIGLLSAQVTILKSNKFEYPTGFRMFHHFYEVSPMNPDIMDATVFDISECFDVTDKRLLQFSTDWQITDDDMIMAENITSDLYFLQRWKAAVYKYSGLNPYSLRISNLRATIENKTLYIKFTILQVHPALPEDVKKTELKAFDAENRFRDNVKSGVVVVKYTVNKKQLTLKADKVSFQINPNFEPHTLPTLEPTTPSHSTKFPFSLITEPNKPTSRPKTTATDVHGSILTEPDTFPTTEQPKAKRVVKTGHQPGTVAAVSIALLLVGISIGSAGTFYKYNGLPSCLRR